MIVRVCNFLLNLVFPKRCPFCGEVLGFTKACKCDKQLMALRLSAEKLSHFSVPHLAESWACFLYKSPVSTACHRLKYENSPHLAVPLGQEMAKLAHTLLLTHHIDFVVPVPMTENAKKERGFNQSELLAQEICKDTGLILQTEWLLKSRDTEKQRELGREERRINVQNAFSISETAKFSGACVLLIDDVLTTGSTLSECAKTLQKAGAKSCFSLTLLAVPSSDST